MRIIAGEYRGRQWKSPKHEGVRPTADRVREALFNILGNRVCDAAFLDLFAGTGAVGIEALSRGAKSAIFCDANHASIRLIQENSSFISGVDFQIMHLSAADALRVFAAERLCFDLIFLDPPFQAGLLPDTLNAIVAGDLLQPDGILVVEHPRKMVLKTPAGLLLDKTRHYGDISLSFFLRIQSPA